MKTMFQSTLQFLQEYPVVPLVRDEVKKNGQHDQTVTDLYDTVCTDLYNFMIKEGFAEEGFPKILEAHSRELECVYANIEELACHYDSGDRGHF